MSKQIIVIGAGPGGLASAMLLASKGYDVKVYEKQSYIGGRNSELRLGEFKFDMGPTFLSSSEGLEYIEKQNIIAQKDNITHICWATGGSLVPKDIMDEYYKIGKSIE